MGGFFGGYWGKKFFIGGLACLLIGAVLLAKVFNSFSSLTNPEQAVPLLLACVFVAAGVILLRHWRSRKDSPEKKLTEGFLGGYWSRKYILGGIACLLASVFFLYDGVNGGKMFYAQNMSGASLDESEAVLAVVLNFLGPYGFAAIFVCLGIVLIRIGMLNKQRLQALEDQGEA